MERIVLNEILKTEKKISYSFSVTEGLKEFFSGKDFVIEYPENIESVPDSVACIPFVASVLPIIWLTNSTLHLQSIDEDFCNCIENIKNGFSDMYPKASFGGKIITDHSEKNLPLNNSKFSSVCFFSGGVDSFTTIFRHIDEKPLLVTLWGSDISFYNDSAWQIMYEKLHESAEDYGLTSCYIKTAFRMFDDEHVLDKKFRSKLEKNYWYDIKHGIGIICQLAPLVYMYGIQSIYIASSNCPEDGPNVKCASDPRIDNHVRFCNAKVFHDGYELNRQKKIKYIIDYKNKHNKPINLHVCWESNTGENCCNCEKCYRTMAGLWIEGEDPIDYGFNYPENVFAEMRKKIAFNCDSLAKNTWTYAKNRLIENWSNIKNKKYAKKIKWIKSFDFRNLDNNFNRRMYKSIHILLDTLKGNY